MVFGTLGLMHLRETPLVLLATAPMVAARLSALTARGLDYRAILITTICASLALSRIPLPLLFTEFRVGRAAVEPPQFFSPQAIAFVQQAGPGGAGLQQSQPGRLHRVVAVSTGADLPGQPPSGLPARTLPPHHRRLERRRSDWNALVAGVDWAMISVPRPNQLSGAGRFPAADWATVYLDDAIEIVVRRSGKYAGLVR